MSTPVDLHIALRAHRDEEMTTLKELHEKLVAATTEEKATLHAEIRSFREASRAKMMELMNNSRPQNRNMQMAKMAALHDKLAKANPADRAAIVEEIKAARSNNV